MDNIFLKSGSNIALVSLSSGVVGEKFCEHQLKIGSKRLEDMNYHLVPMTNSLKGIEYLKNNQDKKIVDFVSAFLNPKYDFILSAIGGDDAIYSIPHLFDNKELPKYIIKNPKPYLGFSDSTVNHLALYKMGVRSFYGQSFLTCIAELDNEMLPYSYSSFKNLEKQEEWVYEPAPAWYEERKKFSQTEVGTSRIRHQERQEWLLLQGSGEFSGHLWGGCVEVLYDSFFSKDKSKIYEKYKLLPSKEDLKNAVVFLETAEIVSALTPNQLKDFLLKIKEMKLFYEIAGLVIGKPQNNQYFEEYKNIYREVFASESFSILYNLPFGHAYPKMILQYGAQTKVSYKEQRMTIYPAPLLDEQKSKIFLESLGNVEISKTEADTSKSYNKEINCSKKHLKVVGGFLWENNTPGSKFLIAQRPLNKERALLWEFIGGKVEKNETEENAVVREFFEELAIVVGVNKKITTLTYEYEDMIMDFTLFEVEKIKGEISLLEHNDLRFIGVSELTDFLFCEACTPLFADLFAKKYF